MGFLFAFVLGVVFTVVAEVGAIIAVVVYLPDFMASKREKIRIDSREVVRRLHETNIPAASPSSLTSDENSSSSPSSPSSLSSPSNEESINKEFPSPPPPPVVVKKEN